MAVEAERLTHEAGARWHAVRRRYKWWQLTLFVVGAIAAVSVLSALFFAVGNKPERIYTDATPPAVDSADFATALGAIVGAPVEHGGLVQVINNGDEFVPELLESIERAQRTINFTVYIWSGGTFSDKLLRALEKKQREGVAVRVLLDGLGSLKVADKEFEPAAKCRSSAHRSSAN
jgi:phosphatidylserine/phosphatidylglycerophosphate/cardiolipin synthase-like enzyme